MNPEAHFGSPNGAKKLAPETIAEGVEFARSLVENNYLAPDKANPVIDAFARFKAGRASASDTELLGQWAENAAHGAAWAAQQGIVMPREATAQKESQGMPAFVTASMKQELLDRGYTRDEVRKMKPEDALRILGRMH